MPHSGVQLKLDRSGGVTAFCGATEIGQGSDDVLVGVRRRGAGHRSVRHPRGHRRHRSHAGRSRLLLEPRHADDGQRRDPGRRARARSARRRRRRRSWSVPPDRLVFADRRVFDAEDPDTRRDASARRCASPRRSSARSAPTGSYTPPKSAARLQGRRRRPVAHLLLLRRRRRGRGRSGDRLDCTCRSVWIAHDIGRALNPVLVRGQVEGSVYMGARRGADGGAGVPPAAAEAVARARAQVPVDARVQEPDDARHAGGRHRPDRGPRSARPVRREGSRARGRCCRSCRRSPTRSTTRSACASTRCRSRRRRSCRRSTPRPPASRRAFGPTRFPDVPWPEPLLTCRRRGKAATARASNEPRKVEAQGRRRSVEAEAGVRP